MELVSRIARENQTWGWEGIRGALANPGHYISDATVGNILMGHGIELIPRRRGRRERTPYT